jgi:hypothetical protein
LLGKVVHTQLVKGQRVKGKLTYKVKINNASPLVLNGLAVAGPELSEKNPPSVIGGMTLPPHKSYSLPATAELVERLHLKDGVRPVAADLSSL